MNTARRWDGIAILSICAAVAVTATLYGRLPDPIPTHFDLHGTPNGWMPRVYGAWFVPVLAVLLWTFIRFAARVLPSGDRKRLPRGTVALVAMLTASFLAAIHIIILYVAVVPGMSITHAVFLVVGVFFVCLGLVMPRVRRNPIIGVRTAWALRSDENWARTQRVGGYAMVLAGIAGGLAGAFGGPAGGALAFVCFLLAGLVPAAYSLVLARRHDDVT
jgi:uncharacterized membrane protein